MYRYFTNNVHLDRTVNKLKGGCRRVRNSLSSPPPHARTCLSLAVPVLSLLGALRRAKATQPCPRD